MLRVTWSIHRHRLVVVGAVLFVAGALAGVLRMLPPTPVAPVLLGDSAAPRAEPAAPAPLIADPPVIRPAAPARTGPASGPARPGADRGLLATRLPDEGYAAPALAAIQCAAGNGELARDTTLDDAAAGLWRATVAEPELELSTVAGNQYAYVAAVPVTLAPGLESVTATGATCPFAGMDFSQLNLSGLSAVGVAVFADADLNDGMDDSTVMIVGR